MKKDLDLFAQMLRIRMVEEAIANKYSEQKMRCPTHLSIGQEAVAVGVSSNLTRKDKVYSSHRAHAHYLAKGGSLLKLIAELYGKQTGCTGGRGGSMHLCDLDAGFMASTAIVGNSIPLAVGHALHLKNHAPENCSVAYFGEGATEEGAFYESLNFAILKNLPALFVCENNRYSVYSPLEVRQPEDRRIYKLAAAMGIEAVEVDGNDVIAVDRAIEKGRQFMLKQQKPFFIECHTYRHREHCGPNWDDELNYRSPEEVEHWIKKDPISTMMSKLPETDIADLRKAFSTEIANAFQEAENAQFPSEETIAEYLYA